MLNVSETTWIRRQARKNGFPVIGITAVVPMDPSPLRDWLAAGYGAGMDYLHRHVPLRANLEGFLPDARSVIVVALPYPGPAMTESRVGTVAAYACGEDYHTILHERLAALWGDLAERHPGAQGRIFVDSGPLPERELARRAGVGWVGTHSCLIHPQLGSRFVLGEILTTLELQETPPLHGACGSCQACRLACPTGAIIREGIIDARRCLSYLTIEHRGNIPRDLRRRMGTRLFGCDSCQDACPYNRRVGEIDTLFTAVPDLIAPKLKSLFQLTLEDFSECFRGTAIYRARRSGLLRNACIVLANAGNADAIPVLRAALKDADQLVRLHAAWGLAQLGDYAYLKLACHEEMDEGVLNEIRISLEEGGISDNHQMRFEDG